MLSIVIDTSHLSPPHPLGLRVLLRPKSPTILVARLSDTMLRIV